jgi:hypothetical protein
LAIGSSAGMDKGVLYREGNSQVWNRSEQRDIRFGGFRGAKAVGVGGLAGAGIRRRLSRRDGTGGTGGGGRHIFFLGGGRAWLRVDDCGLLPATPCGGIDLRLGGRRGGFLLRRGGETVGDEVLHGHDHGEGLDLSGNAATGHIGAEVGDFPEAG